MSQKINKIICTMGAEFPSMNEFLRIDIRSPSENKNRWFYFITKPSDEMIPFHCMEIIDNEANSATLRELLKELGNDKIQNNT